MYAVTVHFSIYEHAIADFLPQMLENARASLREEPGCHRFDVCWNDADPGEIFLYEIYDDRPAFDAHLASSHFLRFDAAVADMVSAKAVKTFERVRE